MRNNRPTWWNRSNLVVLFVHDEILGAKAGFLVLLHRLEQSDAILVENSDIAVCRVWDEKVDRMREQKVLTVIP